ncbi:hypothetical protein, partial [Mesorhizobium sp.]|uniref:hypothetical protein n=1 Tax=Mesorhizobium sp. TaxID=1871066 RepID=UPI0025DA383E
PRIHAVTQAEECYGPELNATTPFREKTRTILLDQFDPPRAEASFWAAAFFGGCHGMDLRVSATSLRSCSALG